MLAKHATNGWILPLNDVPGGKELMAQYDPQELKSTSFTVNGKTYGLPMHYMTYRVMYNKSLFKKFGIVDENGEAKAPQTWQDVYNAAKIITEKGESKVFGFGAPLKWNDYAMQSLFSQSASSTGVFNGYDYKTGKFNFSVYKPIIEIMRKMYKEKLLFPGAEGLENDSLRAHFAEGNVGIITGASWGVGVFNTQFVPKDDWGVCEPIYLEGQPKYKEMVRFACLLGIGKNAQPKIDKVMEVYKFIASEKFLTPAYENASWIPSEEMVSKATKTPEKKALLNLQNAIRV